MIELNLSQQTAFTEPSTGKLTRWGFDFLRILMEQVQIWAGLNPLAASTLVGRGSLNGPGVPQEISLGAGLTMTGTVLSATGSGAGGGYPAELGHARV